MPYKCTLKSLNQKMKSLIQGSKSIEDYNKEIKDVMIRVNVVRDKKTTMVRFLNGLNHNIANIVELEHYIELEKMIHMTTKVKQ